MIQFKRNLTDIDTSKNLEFLSTKSIGTTSVRAQSAFCTRLSTQTPNSLRSSKNTETKDYIPQLSPVLNRLQRLESLIQAQKFKRVRTIKERATDPGELRQEYANLMERYKKIKGKCLMTPCKIPRSGLHIFPLGNHNY